MFTLSLPEQAFIRAHLTDDVRALALQTPPPGLDLRKLVAQIAARQKAREKLPTWYANDALIFPPALSVEQASSEQTAQYKASLVSGNRLLDLTGGMGVDSWAFAQQMHQVTYLERNEDLAQLAAHNLPLLGSTNVSVQAGDGLAFLETSVTGLEATDWIYLDPHRRDATGSKVVQLADCEPDMSKATLLTTLLKSGNRILLKASPLLDIKSTVQQFAGRVESVHIVAVSSEVKEILFVLCNQLVDQNDILVNAVNLSVNETKMLSFRWYEERTAAVTLGDPRTYLYEPNAAVLKAGAFRLVAARFGLTKIAPHSHLYTNDEVCPDFPGRIFSVLTVIKPDAKLVRLSVPDLKANVTVRNFPQTVADLRKKLALREGGDIYIMATTLLNGDKRLIITKKVK